MYCYSNYDRCDEEHGEIKEEPCKRFKSNPVSQSFNAPSKNAFDTLPTGILFEAVGFEKEFSDTSPLQEPRKLDEIISDNTEYEDSAETWFTKSPAPIPGCTDPLANNYNAAATVDDGSCTYDPPPVPGCTDPLANNYNAAATVDDGSCAYDPPPVPGCTDPLANNYNAAATLDDGSCTYDPCTPYQAEILYKAAQEEIPYEPASFQFDTRVETTKIQHDYLWALENNFAYNFHFGLNFSTFTTTAVKATTAPANVVFWAYRPGSPWNTRYNAIIVTGPAYVLPANPDPTFYTSKHWEYVYRAKWATVYETAYYDITRYASPPYTDTSTWLAIQVKMPYTGFNNGSVSSIAQLTTRYNATIHYKQQFTLEQCKEHTYMWYLNTTRYLQPGIQTVTTGASIHPQFSTWTAQDVTDFKTWATSMVSTPNKYYTGPEIQYQAASAEIPYQAEVIGTCPQIPGCKNPQANNYNAAATIDDGSCTYNPPRFKQYSPSFTATPSLSAAATIDAATAASQATTTFQSTPVKVFSQDPDGIGWIHPNQWQQATWDGIPFDTTNKTNGELCEFLLPGSSYDTGATIYVVRGIRELFYQYKPFKDNKAPTVAEIDNWNIEVIRHFRRMFGNPIPLNPDARLFLEARWAAERKYTKTWDAAYPATGTIGDPYGPCWSGTTAVDTAAGHCGAAFYPGTSDRTVAISESPYLNNLTDYPELTAYETGNRRANAEGISGAFKELPWSIKMANVLSQWICQEGLQGHPGPFVGTTSARETIGFSWYDFSPTWLEFRGKYR